MMVMIGIFLAGLCSICIVGLLVFVKSVCRHAHHKFTLPSCRQSRRGVRYAQPVGKSDLLYQVCHLSRPTARLTDHAVPGCARI
jgi:hypothetical protein